MSALMDPDTRSISLEDLFGANPVIPGFKSAFISKFETYVGCGESPSSGCPGDGSSPGDPICPPCEGIIGGGEGLILIDYLINSNCTEFYFPRGFGFISIDITSTAHPLDTFGLNTYNDGNKRISAFGGYAAPHVLVNTSYINNNNHLIIVARPFRIVLDTICDYSQYSDIDFTDFLDGNW